MAQWADLINSALADIGAAAGPGQTISTTAQNDAFLRLQQMIDAWSIDPLLALFQVQHQSFNFVAQTYAYSLGPSGTLVTATSPVRITGGSSVFNGGAAGVQRKAMTLMSIDEFSKVVNDPVSSLALLPEVLAVDRAFPNINIRVFRTPTSATAFMELNWWIPMLQPVNVTDTVSLPPGFQFAIQKNLAVRLYPEYARERGIDPVLLQDAQYSLNLIRKVNSDMLTEGTPQAVPPVPTAPPPPPA